MSEQPRLLVVEDELMILLGMQRFFEGSGYRVDAVASAAAAEAALHDPEPVAAAISDLRLGNESDLSGLDVLAGVQRHSPEARLVLLTAYASQEIRREAEQLGVARVLSKPVPLAELLRILEQLGCPQPVECDCAAGS